MFKKIKMKKILLNILMLTSFAYVHSQETIYPAPAQSKTVALTHATIHTGTGQVINDGMIVFANGKIISVGPTEPIKDNAQVIDCTSKQIYPGLIDAATNLGLDEISAVRATSDEYELGDINPTIQSMYAYNTDSKIINTVRSNGVLLCNVVPGGGIISGASSVMQLDAWNWEDAVYKANNGIHFRMPSLLRFPGSSPDDDPVANAMKQIDNVRTFFRQAKAYLSETKHDNTNIKFEAVKGLFDQSQIFYVHCELVKEIMIAVDFAKEFSFRTVVVGGTDSWKVADYLKQNNIPVILGDLYSLPAMQDDDIDQPFKTPLILQKAGVIFCLSDNNQSTRYRNLPFDAGIAVANGLTKEEALQSITLNAAKLLSIDKTTGSLEVGKDANIVISDGDILDIKSSNITYAFIQGRQINLDNKQKQLNEKYKYKYGIK